MAEKYVDIPVASADSVGEASSIDLDSEVRPLNVTSAIIYGPHAGSLSLSLSL